MAHGAGLTSAEASVRLAAEGPNLLPAAAGIAGVAWYELRKLLRRT